MLTESKDSPKEVSHAGCLGFRVSFLKYKCIYFSSASEPMAICDEM